MKIRKTPLSKRSVYTYTYYDGDGKECKVTLRPGENGVTEMDIKMLHDFDDREVYSNIKNIKPPTMPWDVEWNEAHPNEERLKNYTLSIDAFFNDERGEDYSDRILNLQVMALGLRLLFDFGFGLHHKNESFAASEQGLIANIFLF